MIQLDELGKTAWGILNPISAGRDICGATILKMAYRQKGEYGWEVDYIVPLSRGGTDSYDNLRPLHWKNKAAKGDKLDGEWKCAKSD